jgi:hypothetical protein
MEGVRGALERCFPGQLRHCWRRSRPSIAISRAIRERCRGRARASRLLAAGSSVQLAAGSSIDHCGRFQTARMGRRGGPLPKAQSDHSPGTRTTSLCALGDNGSIVHAMSTLIVAELEVHTRPRQARRPPRYRCASAGAMDSNCGWRRGTVPGDSPPPAFGNGTE